MLSLYQSIPLHIDPIAFSIGFFAIRWYSLGYLAGFVVVAGFAYRKIEEDGIFLAAFWGMLLGGRLGYVFLYDFGFFWNSPLAIVSPFDAESGAYRGIYGMSYYGALIGATVFSYAFAKMKGLDFWRSADIVILLVPLGYFFGRLGNFFNGELYGRVTNKFWGMYFPQGGFVLRHPSQLYEAFFEGLVLFGILWFLGNLLKGGWKRYYFPGILFWCYVFGYSFFRFWLEFFRQPDSQIAVVLEIFTLGQILAFIFMILSAVAYWHFQNNSKNAII